ncbi:hypothetical protein GY45DRAFT_1387560 [Cubamyces sp. BRFM 1775]|nr:hypothetical protein GY45DRAFT_1387560 [Cubamyces sp. BRFM 1775]
MRIVEPGVVGYLLLYPPSTAREVLNTVVTELTSCDSQRSTGKADPHEAVYNLGAILGLARDNFRCMVTGKVDWGAVRSGLTNCQPHEVPVITQSCHIFPESLGNVAGEAAECEEHDGAARTVWTTLRRFGYQDICEELKPAATPTSSNLHRLENVLTLEPFVHQLFCTLQLWFEAVGGQPNVYKIALAPGTTHDELFLPPTVRFVSHHPGLPLPNPRYLHVHAACCRIAHMSGAADYLDSVLREMEEMRVLAEDGTSVDVLTVAIHRRLAGA